MAKPQDGSKVPKWFNWLAHLDAEVSKLPVTATSWEYSVFTLARYPRLQPAEHEFDEPNRLWLKGWPLPGSLRRDVAAQSSLRSAPFLATWLENGSQQSRDSLRF